MPGGDNLQHASSSERPAVVILLIRQCAVGRSVSPRVATTTHGPPRNEWALSALWKQPVTHSPFPVLDRLSRAQFRVWLRPRSFCRAVGPPPLPFPGDSLEHQLGTSRPQGGHPPHHSITSSARTINVIGTWSPIALAALRLMISSNLVGCSTGRLEGLAPRRILST
jgi:hypothetical protein